MFAKMLQTAMNSSGEVIVETKYYCDGVKGRVLDFDGTHFTIFHNGNGGGMLWAFRVEDVAYCGLVVDIPTPLRDMSENNGLDLKANVALIKPGPRLPTDEVS